MRKIAIYVPILLILALVIFGSYEFEMWKWHLFQKLTHSKISFLEYMFLFGGHR